MAASCTVYQQQSTGKQWHCELTAVTALCHLVVMILLMIIATPLHLRLCTVDCSVKMVSHWRTSGRLTGTDSLQTQAGSHSECSISLKVAHRNSFLTPSSALSQVPCVTSSGQIRSLRSVHTHPLCIRATFSQPLFRIII